jgi:hypothetical protein
VLGINDTTATVVSPYQKGKNDKEGFTKDYKDLTTGTPLILGTDIRFCERGSSFCFTSDTRRDSDK